MSSNFYDASGFMIGGDKHLFLMRAVLPITWVTGVPVETWHLVFARNSWDQNEKHTPKVTSEGNWMCQRDFSIESVPHVPLFPYNIAQSAALEIPLLIFIIVTSESKPKLWAHSVHGQGLPLACCLGWWVGYNANCGGHGLLIQLNTVRTTPSKGDYAAFALDVICNFLMGVALDTLPAPISWIVDKTIKSWVSDQILEFMRDKLQEWIDGL